MRRQPLSQVADIAWFCSMLGSESWGHGTRRLNADLYRQGYFRSESVLLWHVVNNVWFRCSFFAEKRLHILRDFSRAG